MLVISVSRGKVVFTGIRLIVYLATAPSAPPRATNINLIFYPFIDHSKNRPIPTNPDSLSIIVTYNSVFFHAKTPLETAFQGRILLLLCISLFREDYLFVNACIHFLKIRMRKKHCYSFRYILDAAKMYPFFPSIDLYAEPFFTVSNSSLIFFRAISKEFLHYDIYRMCPDRQYLIP